MPLQINFNGKTYSSLEEMPPEARQAYEQALALMADQNGNGVPDMLDGFFQGQAPEELLKPLNALSSTFTQVVFNGQTYANPEAMPPEARAAYEQALGTLDQNRNGMPDTLEQAGFRAGQPGISVSTVSVSAPAPASFATPYTPAGLEPDGPAGRGRRWRLVGLLALAGALLVLMAALMLLMVFVLPGLLNPR